MNYYSLAEKSRHAVVIILAIAAVVLVNVLGKYDHLLPFYTAEESWLGYNELVFPLFGVLLFLLDRYVWCWPLINGYLDVPDLNGKWVGTLQRTQYPDMLEETGIPISLIIKQTYLTISICLENHAEDSASGITISHAETVSIEGNRDAGYNINHIFRLDSGYGAAILGLQRQLQTDILKGDYVSTFPRKGTIEVSKLKPGDQLLQLAIRTLTSEEGLPYLAIPIEAALVTGYRKKLGALIGHEKFTRALKNREVRDGLMHHLTIVPPLEYETLNKEQIAKFEGKTVQLALTGLGCIPGKDASCYFVTAVCPHAALLRTKASLGEHDFHITLGFDPVDIHGQPKTSVTWMI